MGNRERGGPKEYDDMVARVSQLCRQERPRTRKEHQQGSGKKGYPVKKEGTNILKEIK